MANLVEQASFDGRSTHDLVESIFQDVQKKDGNGTAVARDHGIIGESQVLSISSAPSTFEVVAANNYSDTGRTRRRRGERWHKVWPRP